MKILLILAKKLLKNKKKNFSNILRMIVSENIFFASNSPQTTSNVFSLKILTLRPFTHFQPKIRATKFQKSAEIRLTL